MEREDTMKMKSDISARGSFLIDKGGHLSLQVSLHLTLLSETLSESTEIGILNTVGGGPFIGAHVFVNAGVRHPWNRFS